MGVNTWMCAFCCLSYLTSTDTLESSDPGMAVPQESNRMEMPPSTEEPQSQILSSLRLENQLLRSEVASLNQEMASVIQRAKDMQDGESKGKTGVTMADTSCDTVLCWLHCFLCRIKPGQTPCRQMELRTVSDWPNITWTAVTGWWPVRGSFSQRWPTCSSENQTGWSWSAA